MTADGSPAPGGRLDGPALDRLATALVAATRREYPHRLIQELNSDTDVVPPRVLNPSFFGSYDWHSAVHSHWSLVRCLAGGVQGETAAAALRVLDEHLSDERLAGELSFYSSAGGRTCERPYGWAWLVMLHAECGRLASSRAASPVARTAAERWASALAPLNELLRGRLIEYFSSVLAFPVRSGMHANTAYSLQLLRQAAAAAPDPELAGSVSTAALRWFANDAPLPWSGPPSGEDFLDAPLVEAALMADVLGREEFAAWMGRVCPPGCSPDWRPPSFARDASEPGAVHLEGLLVSRAWCLARLAGALEGSPLAEAARSGLDAHLEQVAGIDACDGFGRAHWLPTYLIYLDAWLARAV